MKGKMGFLIILGLMAWAFGSLPARGQTPVPSDLDFQEPAASALYESGREEWVFVRHLAKEGGCLGEEIGSPEEAKKAPASLEVLSCSTPGFCEFVRRSLQEKGRFPDLGLNVVTSQFVSGENRYHLFLKPPPGARPIPVQIRLFLETEALFALAEARRQLPDRQHAYALMRVALDGTDRPSVVEAIYVDASLAPSMDAVRDGLRVKWESLPARPLVLFVLLTVSALNQAPDLNWTGYVP